MRRLRIIHRLRMVLAVLGFLGAVGLAAALWWANRTGLPDSWRAGIEEALAAHGVHVELASLRYFPLRGIEASEVVIYADPAHRRVVATLDRLRFDMDRTKLSRGNFKVRRLDLSGASVTLAIDPDDPASKALEIVGARGRIEFSGTRRMEISGASGTIGGLRLELEALLQLYHPGGTATPEDMERSRAERRRVLRGVIDALDRFELEAVAPPRLRVELRGDLEEPGSLRADVNLRGASLVSRGIDIQSIDVEGEVRGRTLALRRIDLATPCGTASGKLEYDLDRSRGRFEFRSDTDLPALLAQLELVDRDVLPGLSRPPELKTQGHFVRAEDGWAWHLMGDLVLHQPRYRGLGVERLATRFSWDGSRLLLEDLQVRDGAHRLAGRTFVTPADFYYELDSSMPLEFWRRLLTVEPLAGLLRDFAAPGPAAARVEGRGKASRRDPLDWWFQGRAATSGLSFRGVPSRAARVTMDLRHGHYEFTDGEVDFDFHDYRLRRQHGGPSSGVVTVDRIVYDGQAGTIAIEALGGAVWPAPVVRTFAPHTADQLEVYRFHRPPMVTADGTIGLESGRQRQDLQVRFACPSRASYHFLGKDLTLRQPRGQVRLLPDRVKLGGLDAGVFGGRVRATLQQRLDPAPAGLDGEIDWTDLRLAEIATTYELASRPAGTITGRSDFRLAAADAATLDGVGHIALEGGELFRVPIFGPLSPLISAVLGRRQAGFQQATDAFCTFQIDDGLLSTRDFITTTPSLIFTGDGAASLPDQTLDLTIRMNARGLFGFLTLPLKPFYGLFQFRGRGPIDQPKWENVMFTSPPKDQRERLLAPPRAKPVPPPRALPVPGR